MMWVDGTEGCASLWLCREHSATFECKSSPEESWKAVWQMLNMWIEAHSLFEFRDAQRRRYADVAEFASSPELSPFFSLYIVSLWNGSSQRCQCCQCLREVEKSFACRCFIAASLSERPLHRLCACVRARVSEREICEQSAKKICVAMLQNANY